MWNISKGSVIIIYSTQKFFSLLVASESRIFSTFSQSNQIFLRSPSNIITLDLENSI